MSPSGLPEMIGRYQILERAPSTPCSIVKSR